MTQDVFLSEIQGYYGMYNSFQLKYVTIWLSKVAEKLYSNIFAEVLKTLSPVYKTPPGVSDLETALKTFKANWIPDEYIPPQIEEPIDPEEKEKGEAGLRELMNIVGACSEKANVRNKDIQTNKPVEEDNEDQDSDNDKIDNED